MTFAEAMTKAVEGIKVRHRAWSKEEFVAEGPGKVIVNELGKPFVLVTDVFDDLWTFYQEPLKRYDFTAALAMMRQGKWMRPVFCANFAYRHKPDGTWAKKAICNGHISELHIEIPAFHLDAMWEEAPQ